MVVKTFRSSGSSACEVVVQEDIDGIVAAWRFLLERPACLVLAFLNEDYSSLRMNETEHISDEQAKYYRDTFSRGNGALLRDMVDHVLVCQEERGFDPITRLAAYSFANEMFDLSRVASFAERVSLEASVVGAEATQLAQAWSALLGVYKQKPFPCREELFKALVQDADANQYPFALGLSMEFPSLPQLLKAFVVEMIRERVLLRRCGDCGCYALAKEPVACPCSEKAA